MKKMIMSLVLGAVLLEAGSLGIVEKQRLKKQESHLFALAKSGNVDAQALLGEMYLDGIGVKQDRDQAFFWISRAANQGDPKALYLLGFMYENGIKVDVNFERAAILYQKAANEGQIIAKYHLALMYREGRGVKKDSKKALSLLEEIVEAKDHSDSSAV